MNKRDVLYKNTLLAVSLTFLSAALSGCQEGSTTTVSASHKDVLAYADPMIGTGGHGHTFPGATVPFGMVQLSPDNISKGWDWTSGYNYSDEVLVGFSHTHLSGTGVGDLLDILMLPMVSNYPENTNNSLDRAHSIYSHDNEVATPGFYSIELPKEQIKAELTTTSRVGVHRYTFGAKGNAQILFDLGFKQNWDLAEETYFKVENDHTLVGYRISSGWAKYQPVYFVAEFDQPFTHQFYTEREAQPGDELKGVKTEAVLTFGKEQALTVVAKVGISYASIDGARKNIAVETDGFNFDKVKSQAEDTWRKQLSTFTVTDQDESAKTKFYSALYHSFLAPNLFSDANGEYYGADGKTHKAVGYDRYTLFSLWDTFRALHPLLTISNPELVGDMTRSMMAFYDEAGLLPSWDLMSNETDIMIGYHAVPVLVDAYFKGLTTVPGKDILAAAKKSAMQDRFGIDLFDKYGYVPSELELEAVSKTLEYAFDDSAIASLAKDLGNEQDYQYFSKRAQSYRTLFDKNTGFMRGKDKNGNWVENFNPIYVSHRTTDYTEANAWQYAWFVPHDVSGLISLYGGEQPFLTKLDELFSMSSAMEGDVSPDISGLIGQYAHGNEPVHHVPYLYSYTSQKYKGEARIKQIRDTMYGTGPDGLAGNDDVGQMSAWYVFSALGFYPVNPTDGKYVFGTPQFDQVLINQQNGKQFSILKSDDNGNNFIEDTLLNGQKLLKNHVSHQQIVDGGELHFKFK